MGEAPPFVGSDQILTLGGHEQFIRNRIGAMQSAGFVDRFWGKDGRLWRREQDDPAITGTMGWLGVAETVSKSVPDLVAFAGEVSNAGFERVVLAGMGGSSLAPLVLAETLAEQGKGLPLSVLDSTDPETVLRIEREGPVEKALFVISSKSGSTAEPNAFFEYFFDKVSKVKSRPGENFVAITDPGTLMEDIARKHGFRKIFLNFADIGGRFSALSYFGMVPAALMGIDVGRFLQTAVDVAKSNQDRPLEQCSAMILGVALGELSTIKIDKLTFVVPDRLSSLGLWLEQLLAESTGKEGKGIFPVAGEGPGSPLEYGSDRVFAYLRPAGEDCTYLDMRVATLRDAGRPVVQIAVPDPYEIAAEFMRWEIATAVAGSVMGINPFDQPNVQESKDVTKRLIAQVEKDGALPREEPTLTVDGLKFYGNVRGGTLEEVMFSFLDARKEGDFVTLMAYLTESAKLSHALKKLQTHIRDCTCLATTMGFGPRFLHSTGQFHKGGPNGGHFIQLTQGDSEDTQLPGRSYTFGQFRNAQALGDRQTLEAHDRIVIRIDLGSTAVEGVERLIRAIDSKPTVSRV